MAISGRGLLAAYDCETYLYRYQSARQESASTHAARMESTMRQRYAAFLGETAIKTLTAPPSPKTYREELQSEINDWLK